MKKKCLPLIIFLAVLSLLSCRKNDITKKYNDYYISIVSNFFERHLISGKPKINNSIKLLQESLDYNNMHIEGDINEKKVLVIPITGNYRQFGKFNKTSQLNLIVYFTKSGEIRDSKISIYTPSN